MSEPNADKQARVEAFLKDARAQTKKDMERRRAAPPEAAKIQRDVLLVSGRKDVAPAVAPGTDPAPIKMPGTPFESRKELSECVPESSPLSLAF
jgi:hypothetical protein